MDQGLEATDLAWVASRRKGLQDAVNIDVQATRALAGRLPASGLREAYQSAIIGDMVVRATTRHWQGHDGRCLCGLEAETVQHVWWRCPRYQSDRQGGNRCSLADAATPENCQGLLGVPMKLPALVQWRLEQHESLWLSPTWRAMLLFVDGSGLHPKDPEARVVGWAMAALVDGEWRSDVGWLLPGESVTAAECTAAARAFSMCLYGGRIVTDCKAVLDMYKWLKKPAGKTAAAAGRL